MDDKNKKCEVCGSDKELDRFYFCACDEKSPSAILCSDCKEKFISALPKRHCGYMPEITGTTYAEYVRDTIDGQDKMESLDKMLDEIAEKLKSGYKFTNKDLEEMKNVIGGGDIMLLLLGVLMSGRLEKHGDNRKDDTETVKLRYRPNAEIIEFS